ncbi:MAG: hypothetical protein NTW94_08630 [Legionellales bacterium]|nr:hypothetical protein [Legionellales bacterium]
MGILPYRWGGVEKYHPTGADQAVETYAQYRKSIWVDDASLPAVEPIETYEKERLCAVNGAGFAKVKVSGEAMDTKLTKSTNKPAATGVRDKISKALEPLTETSDTIAHYKAAIDKIKEKFNDPSERCTPYHVIALLSSLTSETSKKITDQHADEKANIDKLFATKPDNTDSDFVKQLRDSCNLTLLEEVTAVKNDMQAALKEAQDAELKKFQESLQASENKMQQAIALSLRKIFFNKLNHPKNKSEFERLKREHKQAAGAVTAGQEQESDSDYYKHVFLGTLNTFKTNSGLDVTYDPTQGFSIKCPHRFSVLNPYYYPDKFKNDCLTMMEALKATGKTTTTLTINYGRNMKPANEEEQKEIQEKALQFARVVFESALEAGYDDQVSEDVPDGKGGTTKKSQVTVMVNGKETSINDLYASDDLQGRLAQVRAQAKTNAQERTGAVDDVMRAGKQDAKPVVDREYKSMMAKVVADHKARATPAVPAAVPIPGPGGPTI